MKRVLLLHYHEIWLKGGNKKYFLSRLRDAVCQSVADLPVLSLECISDRLILSPGDDAAIPLLVERLRRVFGLAYLALAREVPSALEALGPAACEMMGEANPRNFAVRAKIADSAYPLNSMELERELGRMVLDHLRAREPGVGVKLQEPEVTCQVEIVPGKALIYARRVEGPGVCPPSPAGD